MALYILKAKVKMTSNYDVQDEVSTWYKALMVVVLNNCCAELHYQEECEYKKAQTELDCMETLMSGEHDLSKKIVANTSMLSSPVAARVA